MPPFDLEPINNRFKVVEDKIKTLTYNESKIKEKIHDMEVAIQNIYHVLQDLKTYLNTLK